MPQTCKICSHGARIELERELVRGVSLRDIARRFSISRAGAARHKEHILAEVKSEAEARDEVRTSTIMADIEAARERSEQLYIKVEIS